MSEEKYITREDRPGMVRGALVMLEQGGQVYSVLGYEHPESYPDLNSTAPHSHVAYQPQMNHRASALAIKKRRAT